jgi:hypothetical protein
MNGPSRWRDDRSRSAVIGAWCRAVARAVAQGADAP